MLLLWSSAASSTPATIFSCSKKILLGRYLIFKAWNTSKYVVKMFSLSCFRPLTNCLFPNKTCLIARCAGESGTIHLRVIYSPLLYLWWSHLLYNLFPINVWRLQQWWMHLKYFNQFLSVTVTFTNWPI